LFAAVLPAGAAAQEDIDAEIRRSQDRLEEIRQEQQRLAREESRLRGQIRTVGDELQNIEAQIGTSASALAEFDVQATSEAAHSGSPAHKVGPRASAARVRHMRNMAINPLPGPSTRPSARSLG
jgi:chromosome segregation ATPase